MYSKSSAMAGPPSGTGSPLRHSSRVTGFGASETWFGIQIDTGGGEELGGPAGLADEEGAEARPQCLGHLHAIDLRRKLLRLPIGREIGAARLAPAEMRFELRQRVGREVGIEVIRQLRDRLLAGHARGPR